MIRVGFWLLLLQFTLPATARAQTETLEKLLVADLAVEEGISASTARLLGDLISTELQKTGRWDVVAEADIKAMLQHEEQKQLAGCDNVACIAEIGGALGAERVLSGSVGQVGDLYLLNLKVVNSLEATVEARWSDSVGGDESALVAAVKVAVADLLRQLDPEAAAAYAATQPPTVSAASSAPIYEKWWFWTAVGVVVVGGGIATYFALRGDDDSAAPGTVAVTATLPDF